ncbi:Asp23/Gls24 family envelope stress response protein [Streptomyces sp. NBC_00448]|uniref:Asp23/Gls24 family envelope stress response protein n=1 Tax=Streptomyces sp. NBC_00448 TaxID=2903652 RepID=UPI002E1E2F0A
MAMTSNPGGAGRLPGQTPEPLPDDEQLLCGRMLSEVWESTDSGESDSHTLHCPYCSAALADLDLLGGAIRELRSRTPPPMDTASLAERVMDVVRSELRPGRTLPLGEPEEDAWITEATAARVLRAAAESLPGVRAGSCRIAPVAMDELNDPLLPARPGLPGREPVRVRLEVTFPFAPDLNELADQVRQEVFAAADRQLGMRVAAVDVRLTDLLDEAASEGRTR